MTHLRWTLRDPLVFGTRAYDYLTERICREGELERGRIETRFFPDGERYLRIVSPIRGRDAVLIGGTISEADTTEVFDLACGLVGYGAQSLTLIIPYFSYSTMDRNVRRGEVVTGKTRARLISAIPPASHGNRLLLLDLHSEGLPHYFEGGMQPRHIYAKPLIVNAAHRLGGDEFLLACTDAGRAKWVESLANDLGVQACFVFKRRVSDTTTEVMATSARVGGKRVVIYDDMIRTGSSVLGAAEAYLEAGASSVAAVCTHGLFPGDSLEKLEASGLLEKLVCTDSHPRAAAIETKGSDLVEVVSTAGLFVEALQS